MEYNTRFKENVKFHIKNAVRVPQCSERLIDDVVDDECTSIDELSSLREHMEAALFITMRLIQFGVVEKRYNAIVYMAVLEGMGEYIYEEA